MCTVILALGFLVQQSTLDRLTKAAQQDATRELLAKASNRDAALEEEQFVQRFNELVVALGRFSMKYKAQHVIDVKNVQSIRKAYRNLEKSNPWFKAQE